MALDEATAGFLAEMAESGAKPLHEMTPEEARGLMGMLRDLQGPGPEVGEVRDEQIPLPGGGSILARIVTPTEPPAAIIVYYHGGGWVIGAAPEFETLGRELAQRNRATVVLVDYRKAPEHPYPAAADDAWTALNWVEEHKADLGGAGLPLIVAGDSAGGNLSAIVAQRAKAEGGPAISLQVLIYPVTDADLDNETYLDPDNQLMLTRESMIWFWGHYAPDEASRANVDASPMKAEDLSGLPPAVVLTAEHDVLRQEGEAYAERLRAAGVPVEHRRFPGQMHGFFTMVNILPGSAAARDYVGEQIDRHLAALAEPA